MENVTLILKGKSNDFENMWAPFMDFLKMSPMENFSIIET